MTAVEHAVDPAVTEVLRDLNARTWLGRHRLPVADRLRVRHRPGSADYLGGQTPDPLRDLEDALIDAAVAAHQLAGDQRIASMLGDLLSMAVAVHADRADQPRVTR